MTVSFGMMRAGNEFNWSGLIKKNTKFIATRMDPVE